MNGFRWIQNFRGAALAALLLCHPLAASTLMILGDSLSDAYRIPREDGWVELLSVRLGDDHRLINASISGETTAGAVQRIDRLLVDHRPQRLLIILGGNDGLRGLSPGQLEANLNALIEAGLRADVDVAIMQIRLPANLGPVYIERFEAVYARLARRHGIRRFNFFLDSIYDLPGMLMDDGIHPTAQAQLLMLEALWPDLRQWLEPGHAPNSPQQEVEH